MICNLLFLGHHWVHQREKSASHRWCGTKVFSCCCCAWFMVFLKNINILKELLNLCKYLPSHWKYQEWYSWCIIILCHHHRCRRRCCCCCCCYFIWPPLLLQDGLWLVTKNPQLVKDYQKAILTPNTVEFQRLFDACVVSEIILFVCCCSYP